MADIELVIKIPEELKNKIDNANEDNYRTYIWWFETTLYCAIKNGTPLPEMNGISTNKTHLIRKIRDCAKNYPKDYSDKIYDAVTIYEGIEEVHSCGIRKGLELAVSIIETDKEEVE